MPGGFPIAQEDHQNSVEHRREIARTARSAMQGHINAVVDLELDATPATTTTLTSPFIYPGSGFFIHPLDAGAVTEYTAGTLTILEADIGNNQATVRHSASATTRTIRVAILG